MSISATSSAGRTSQRAGGPWFAAGLARTRLGAGVRTLALVILLGASTATLVGCGGQKSSTARHAPAPRTQLASAAPTSMIVYVSDHGRAYVRTSGTPRPNATQRFRIGSVTNTFTATIILQLAAEGKIRLDDTLYRFLPGVVPGGQHITIRELLGHHSGLANYTDFTDWLARADRSTSTRPSDVLRFAASQPPTAPPNSGFQYSDTDYVALGLIIERITGQSLAQELEQRILRPLGLRHTQLATTRTLADLHDEGVNPNLFWAAGGIVSNAPDLARFFSALLSGRILSRSSLGQMEQTIALGDGNNLADGLGIFSTRLPCGRVWGDGGGILDYATLVDVSRDGSRVAVISARGSARPPDVSTLLCHGTTPSRGEVELVYSAEPSAQAPVVTRGALERTVHVVRQRLRTLGIGGARVSVSSANEITVVLPNARGIARAERAVGTNAQLAVYDWEANVLTPNGKTVASQLLAQDANAITISQGSGSVAPGGPGAGSMGLYQAVQLASKQQGWSSSANSRTGPQYWMFGAPGSAACAAAARAQSTTPVIGQHCLLSGPDQNLTDLRSGLPSGVSASEGQILSVPRGWVVLQAIPADFSHPTPIGSPIALAQFYVLKDTIAVRESEITNPRRSSDRGTGSPTVTFGFTPKGKSAFESLTAQIARRGSLVSGLGQTLNQHFAVALDNQLITVPFIDHKQYPDGINGDDGAEIAGSFSITSAQDLANELRLGALPLNLKLKCEDAPATTPCHNPRVP